MATQLLPQYVKLVGDDAALQGLIASALKISIQSPPKWALYQKHGKLTQLDVLKVIKNYVKAATIEELTHEVEPPVVARNVTPLAALKP